MKKENRWHFGYKAYVGVDKDTGLVHQVEVTNANIHDVTIVQQLLTRSERSIYCDSRYIGVQKREDAVKWSQQVEKMIYKINRRSSQGKKNSSRFQAQIK